MSTTATEQLRVRSGAGTGTTILGYLLVDQRARVLSGPTTGTIVLVTVPSGAHVFVNGAEGGATPLSLTLPASEVHIALSLPGYLYYAVTVTVKAGMIVHLTYHLLLLGLVGY